MPEHLSRDLSFEAELNCSVRLPFVGCNGRIYNSLFLFTLDHFPGLLANIFLHQLLAIWFHYPLLFVHHFVLKVLNGHLMHIQHHRVWQLYQTFTVGCGGCDIYVVATVVINRASWSLSYHMQVIFLPVYLERGMGSRLLHLEHIINALLLRN